MLSLDTEERDLVLPQLNVSGFINSPWEFLPLGGVDGRWVRENVKGAGGGVGVSTVAGM